MQFLPYSRQTIEDDDIASVAEALRGDLITTGPLVARYEAEFGTRIGARHAVACSSGTAGLHLAMMALGLGSGDVAIVPSITFLATANAVRFVGAEVAFADVDPETGLLTPETLRAALRGCEARVKVVLPVHLGGAVADLSGIAEVAAACGAVVVEDACHALGAAYEHGGELSPVGACAHSAMAVFSTHPVKSITTGEGGVIATKDDALALRLRHARSHGMEHDPARWLDPDRGCEDGRPAPWHYEMAELGYNYRLTDLASALGLSQLNKLARFVSRRAALARRYDELLAALAPQVQPPCRARTGRSSWHLYAVRIDFAGLHITRSEVMRRLRASGIGTQVHYIPVHSQPYYRKRYGSLELPGAESYFRRCLSLPLFPSMADSDVDRVVEALANALGMR